MYRVHEGGSSMYRMHEGVGGCEPPKDEAIEINALLLTTTHCVF